MSAQRMSNADAAWLHMDRPTNLMIVNALLWFEEPVDVERVREIVRSRLVEPFPRFRQVVTEPRLGVGMPSWEDDRRFDLDRHFHHLAVPAPGDKRALEELVSDLMVSPLDRRKPLWDWYLVDGFGGGMAMIARIHHCIADGIALSRVLLSLTDSHPDAGIAPQRDGAGRGLLGSIAAPVKAGAQLAQAGVHEGIEILTHPTSELPALASRGTADAVTLAKLLLTGSDAKTVLNARVGVSRRVTWSDRMPLDGIKAIGHATGTTVNDVLTAAMTGALRRYLVGRDSLVDEIRAMVPYNLREPDEPLPRELGNRFGLVYLTLPVGIADPADRLAEVHRRMAGIKHSREGGLSYAILEAVGLTHRTKPARCVRAEDYRGANQRLGPARAGLFRGQQDRRGGSVGPGRGDDRDGHQHLQLQRGRDRRPAGRRRAHPRPGHDHRRLRARGRDAPQTRPSPPQPGGRARLGSLKLAPTRTYATASPRIRQRRGEDA
jgi:diacylglycerol O-acyltransferase / wax synthase